MDQVRIVDAGSELMVSGPSRAEVDAALAALVAEGARMLAPAAQLGSRWVAICEKPEGASGAAAATAQGTQASTDEALLGQVKISDTGDHLMITGPEQAAVAAALAALEREGARVLSAPAPLGNGWIAACEKRQTVVNRQCTVERAGFQFLVRGPSQTAVAAKVADLAARGAKPVGSIEYVGGEWVAVCDIGEMSGIMHIR